MHGKKSHTLTDLEANSYKQEIEENILVTIACSLVTEGSSVVVRTSEKYGDKWFMTESKIDGNSGKTVGTPDAGKIHVSMYKDMDMQKFNTYQVQISESQPR